jgi:hypothetical protein
MTSEKKERVSGVVECILGPASAPLPPPRGEPITQESAPPAQEPPPLPAPQPGQLIALVDSSNLSVIRAPAPISLGATLVSWRPAKGGHALTYSDSTVLFWQSNAGSNGAYRLMAGPPKPEAPYIPPGTPPVPIPGQSLPMADGKILVAPSATPVSGQAWPGGYVYHYPDGTSLRYDFSSGTWSVVSSSSLVAAPPDARAGRPNRTRSV